ncbi:MAG: hypothetical protein JST19_18775 [Bacteroidetes bacterium]|nr:hypothetical protein [Bacteroidota bacterium]
MKFETIGKGTSVPPIKEHVIIYFSEKGADRSQAMNFFVDLDKRKWKNNRGKLIANWKCAAWNYILNLKFT